MHDFKEKYGPWGLITGAARGIGKAFAENLASKGLNLILVDILEKELLQTVGEIQKRFSVVVESFVIDLEDVEQVTHLLKTTEKFTVGLICCNHTASHIFPDGKLRSFLDTPKEKLHSLIQINLNTTIDLIHHYAEKMSQINKGGIIIVSSGAAYTGVPYLAQYGASKAFMLNLGEALWWELKSEGIDVITVLPGATKTPGALQFYNHDGIKNIPMMDPMDVVKLTIRSLGKKVSIVPGWKNKLQTYITAYILPRKQAISFLGSTFTRFFNIHK